MVLANTHDGAYSVKLIPAVYDVYSGVFTVGGAEPPSSVYEDGRVYLRNAQTDDALLLGSTHGVGPGSGLIVTRPRAQRTLRPRDLTVKARPRPGDS